MLTEIRPERPVPPHKTNGVAGAVQARHSRFGRMPVIDAEVDRGHQSVMLVLVRRSESKAQWACWAVFVAVGGRECAAPEHCRAMWA